MSTDRLLGYAPLEGLDGLLATLNAVPGPAVEAWHGSSLAALLQSEPDDTLFCAQQISQAAGLPGVQRRLELACHTGPFLPQDPAAATVPSDAVPSLLSTAWPALDSALFTHGTHQQWEILLRWSPEAILARQSPQGAFLPAQIISHAARTAALRTAIRTERTRQEARLLNALSRAVLAFAADGSDDGDTAIRVTALIKTGTEHRMETALESLEEGDLGIELRGPMPPVTFSPVRIVTTEAIEITGAWHTLELGERTDRTHLQKQWRHLAASLRPDRQSHRLSGAAPGIAGLTDAYRMLRSLLPASNASARLPETLGLAGRRLIVPEAPVSVAPPIQRPLLELTL
jgi:Gas vesicle synthesis protein GvpL/GvpF